ncbi:diguanylate cyclase with PAS/PAC sensor [Rippkaea orientalis PCC 8801]|uniref:Diguanylate cyclase with PAS/PAC sensor n=1 Tax=Rippkaea orientalis (strain PCC 8801 / RF-1) TaxID=41431 RepID=B7JZG8_RIPO1|nr:diguanylate cyclase [Rippkaea orientalis]ACK64128.1 diguanylate cyclase with PAS/PAC sensor [Rippkaea orientalis PCC 8801]
MWNIIRQLFFPNSYIPHGHCYLWQTPLVWLHLVSDALITLAYYSIPLILLYFVRKREDIPFRDIFILFSAFILSCGTTHIMNIWTLWNPAYWLSGGIKAFTAFISIFTAIQLFTLIPKALSLPSPSQLEALNHQLQNQIKEREAAEQIVRQLNEELEHRVQQRTTELKTANQKLQKEILERQQVELALRESQRFTKRIADLTPNLLYVYDIVDQKNIYCNRFIKDLLGYTPEEIQQKNIDIIVSLIHPDDQQKLNRCRTRLFNLRDEDYLQIEGRLKDSEDNWHWIQIRKTIFERTIDGEPKQILSVASDITPSKEAEITLQQVNLQLAERVQELEIRTQELICLGEITDLLQACLSVSEAEKILADLVKPLFPNYSGAIFTIKDLSDTFELVAHWGNSLNTAKSLLASQCWGLRRGNTHGNNPDFPGLYCQHIYVNEGIGRTLCIPMIAHGETLGLLYLNLSNVELFNPSQQHLAEAVSKQIAIAFANLKLRETLEEQSLRDPLTGLFNRRYLEISINRELNTIIQDQDYSLGLIMLDIDHFKQFNDNFGHEAGDLVLQTVANCLQNHIRQSDIACRFGGEEFMIILPRASLNKTLERAEKIRESIKQLKIEYKSQPLDSITASFGVAAFPQNGTTLHELFIDADKALYQAKKQGRDRVVCAFSPNT